MDSKDKFCNIKPSIEQKMGRNLHNQKNHPIEIIKKLIYKYFDSLENYNFKKYDTLSPIVSTSDNFDKLLIPKDHPCRKRSDTYYVNNDTVLRTQTSAHQNELFAQGVTSYLVAGDVYRKDEIDKSHYPVFHQMEGVSVVSNGVDVEEELFRVLDGLVEFLFPNCEYRRNDDYFPFTEPSYEYEVKYKGEWLEILGCGITHQEILNNNNLKGKYWAFGLGLERLCMVLFNIPDIRYMWTTDNKFLDQFRSGEVIEFKPYSKLDAVTRDVSFWLSTEEVQTNGDGFEWSALNDFYEYIREITDDLVEQVKLMDKFYNKKKDLYSHTFRVTFKPVSDMKNPAVLKKLCDTIMSKWRSEIEDKFKVTLR
jgi:phenylalanyl-tRNA synthetase alpha chain